MKRTNIIQALIDKINAKSYLEIGISSGENFEKIQCERKIGVDPELEAPATIHITSDLFFENNEEKFDVIFIDGLHHSDQVYRDIINSLNCLNENGYIICHDMNPQEEEHQIIPFNCGIWNGDCWKAFVKLRQERYDLEMSVVNADYGCGIIKKGMQDILKIDVPIDYKNFDLNRKEWLNLIDPEEFYSKFVDLDINVLLKNHIMDPDNDENNFVLGNYYFDLGQTASALSYYLRCAERTDDDLLRYECLILGSMCFDRQGTRAFTVKGMLQHAVSLFPKRPEAYYLLSRFYERDDKDGHWNDSYLIASIGEKVCDFDCGPLRRKVDYPGKYGVIFQKAVAGWWCGLCDESRTIFRDLYDNYDLDSTHTKSVIDNLAKLNDFVTPGEKFVSYKKEKYQSLKVKFSGSELIEKNYSEAYQDIFVLTMLNGKRNGTYLEIGAGNSFYGNNTALLEQQFDWTGVSLDIEENFVTAHRNERKNPCILKDATVVNYNAFLAGLDFPKEIDYLQLDCDPPSTTYQILLTIPFEKYKFAVITYEHDYYCDETKSFQEKSRKYLQSQGYIRVVNNISPDDFRPYEDWWVHPDLVDMDIIKKMSCINEKTKKAEKYLFGAI